MKSNAKKKAVDKQTNLRAMIIDDDFTATSEEQMRGFANAYRLCLELLEQTADEDKAEFLTVMKQSFGKHYSTAKRCYELMYG